MRVISALALILAHGPLALQPADMHSSEKIGAVCRRASSASLETGDSADWLRVIRDAGDKGGLEADDQTLLLRMCGIYAVAERDAAQVQLQGARQRLSELGN
jgi:hypothetical protein